jgi:hypothetical protein
MRTIRNIDKQAVRSFIRDGFLSPEVLMECGLEQGLLTQVLEDLTANRMWLHNGGTFIAIAICLSNDGKQDQVVDEYDLEIPWAPQVELLRQSEQSFAEIFVAGGEEFPCSSVLNRDFAGARLHKRGGSIEGILIFRAYGRPSQEELSPTMPLKLRVYFASGLESVGSVQVRFDSWRELAAQPGIATDPGATERILDAPARERARDRREKR